MEKNFEWYKAEYDKLEEETRRELHERVSHDEDFKTKTGFYPWEVWNVNYAVARFLFLRLAYLKEHNMGFPPELDETKWHKFLEEMTWGFYLIAAKDDTDYGEDDNKAIGRALDLFHKYFWDLWD